MSNRLWVAGNEQQTVTFVTDNILFLYKSYTYHFAEIIQWLKVSLKVVDTEVRLSTTVTESGVLQHHHKLGADRRSLPQNVELNTKATNGSTSKLEYQQK